MGRYETYGTHGSIDGVLLTHGLAHHSFVYYGPVTTHVVKPNEDLALISYINYDDFRYWWAIAWANDLQDPYLGFSAGDVLKIPVDLQAIHDMLENQ